ESGVHTGFLEQVDDFLGGDVAARARRERAATQSAHGHVELGDADLDRGQHTGQARAAGVVQVHADLHARARGTHRLDQFDEPSRDRGADRVRDAEPIGAELYGAPCGVDGPGHRSAPVERAIPGAGEDRLAASARVVSQARDVRRGRGGPLGRAPGVRVAVPVGHGDDVLEVRHPGLDRTPCPAGTGDQRGEPQPGPAPEDRKSTRLNSSHVKISYAVFCLKKKNDYDNIESTYTQPRVELYTVVRSYPDTEYT